MKKTLTVSFIFLLLILFPSKIYSQENFTYLPPDHIYTVHVPYFETEENIYRAYVENFTEPVSYTTFGREEEITNYSVRMNLKRPYSYESFPAITAGVKNPGDKNASEYFSVTFESAELVINSFGITKRTYWHKLNGPRVSSSEIFLFEISVTPEKITVYINGYEEYSSIPPEGKEKGFFRIEMTSIKNTGNTTEFINTGFYFHEQKEKITVWSKEKDKIDIEIYDEKEEDSFQLWVRGKSYLCLLENKKSFSWSLIKEFSENIEKENGIYKIQVPENIRCETSEYEIYIRYRENGKTKGNIYQVKKSPDPVKIKENIKEIKQPGISYINDSSVLDFNSGYKGTKIQRDVSGYIVNQGEKTVYYRFTAGEAMRAPLLSTRYSRNPVIEKEFDAPGIYMMTLYTTTNSKGYDDGIRRYIDIKRSDNDNIRGRAKIASTLIQKETPEGINEYILDTGNITMNPGDLITITNTPEGLITDSGEYEGYMYSFFRLDEKGYRLIKDWSYCPVFSFRPAAPGNYTIHMIINGYYP